MATAAVAHSVLGTNRLVGVGGPQLAPSSKLCNKRNVSASATGTCSDSRAIRAISGKSCSSSSHRGLSQSSGAAIVVPSKSNGSSSRSRVSFGSVRSQGGDEFASGRVSLKTEGRIQVDQTSVGRNSASAIQSLSEEHSIAESLDDSSAIPLESDLSSSDNVARPQPVVQGFADSPFVGEFALDLTAGGGVGSSDFDSMSVSVPLYQPKWVWFATSPEQENIIIDRAINAMIVGSAGVLAITKILTVDHDYWHGWTLVEILEYAPVHNWFAYEELLKTHPVLAKMMISGTVYSLGDWIAQCYEGKPVLEFNRTRMLRSGLVGFCLHGSMSHFYYQFCEWLFPFQGWWVIPLKVAFDQTFWSSLWNGIYFVTIGLLRLESPVSIWKELRQTFFPLLTAGWKLWPAAHLVTYGLVPVEQRLLWVDMVEIVWVCILAMYSNEKSEARIAEAETTEEIKEGIIEGAANAASVDDVVVNKK